MKHAINLSSACTHNPNPRLQINLIQCLNLIHQSQGHGRDGAMRRTTIEISLIKLHLLLHLLCGLLECLAVTLCALLAFCFSTFLYFSSIGSFP